MVVTEARRSWRATRARISAISASRFSMADESWTTKYAVSPAATTKATHMPRRWMCRSVAPWAARRRVGREEEPIAGHGQRGQEPRPPAAEHDGGERDVHEIEDAEGVVGAAHRLQQAGEEQRVQGEHRAADETRGGRAALGHAEDEFRHGEDAHVGEQAPEREVSEHHFRRADRRRLTDDRTPAQADQPLQADAGPVVGRLGQGVYALHGTLTAAVFHASRDGRGCQSRGSRRTRISDPVAVVSVQAATSAEGVAAIAG